ncbi:hypothetical protein WA026_014539 [Henosepilachna vigintioctopunctata]|uniref:Pre-mRNA splicing factor component Cdc5p/Cef1 C-terminal domain-containing protein n=1 Tax=Henosepilachna vigintioctopunctata TaxID=420089 RepID=A0AAW1UN12_9CUCU
MNQQNIEGESRSEIEEREKRKDKNKLKQKKENNIPQEIFKNQAPAKKRSKLVLPEPQITDNELQQVVKLGKANEIAKQVAGESGIESTDSLMNNYSSMTPQATSIPRTPMSQNDKILQEAQNLMALSHVDTPLKGGLNTPLHNTDFTSVMPHSQQITTPNTVLATPLASVRSNTSMNSEFATPQSQNGKDASLTGTPMLRDRLSINSNGLGTPINNFMGLKDQLRAGLSSLPQPKNDFEIVVPEFESETNTEKIQQILVEDQADVDEKMQAELKAKAARELKSRSLVIQRGMPRPHDVNLTVLRPPQERHGLSDLQKAEELIKLEMVTMLTYDNLNNPLPMQAKKTSSQTSQQLAFLEQHPYEKLNADDLEAARNMLKDEMDFVKRGMNHGDLPLEAYSQVWEECLSQVLFLPNQHRYTRANLASKKDRLESAEKRLEQNRMHMAKEAKRAAKMEKKLKILTGGYQSRAQSLIKHIQELNEQADQANLDLNTFKFLLEQEKVALAKRKQGLTEDVSRQAEREKALQLRYSELQTQIKDILEEHAKVSVSEVPTTDIVEEESTEKCVSSLSSTENFTIVDNN